MFEELRADDDTLATRRDLADRVQAALTYAGLPACPSGDTQVRSAAEVEVDEMNDEAGGVYVTWAPSADLLDAVVGSYADGRTDGPANESYFVITLAMRDVLMEVLRHCGFRVQAVDDYAMGPPRVLVSGSSDEVNDAIPRRREETH
jgi:hypothetical protein